MPFPATGVVARKKIDRVGGVEGLMMIRSNLCIVFYSMIFSMRILLASYIF